MSTNIDASLENDELRPDDNGICYENKLASEHEKSIQLKNQILVVHPDIRDIPIPVEENSNVNILAKITKEVSITVFIDRGEFLPQLEVVVPESTTTVGDLKKAIKRNFELHKLGELKRNNKKSTTKISWRYIWRTNFLVFDSEKLINDRQLLAYYGVGNRSVLKFLKKTKRVLNSIEN